MALVPPPPPEHFIFDGGSGAGPRPTASRERASRSRRARCSPGQLTRLFAFWCGNRLGGPCPLCARPVARDNATTWQLAHVNGAAQGGPSLLWNLFISCPACNWSAEMGNRALPSVASGTGGSHLDGIVGAHQQNPAQYSAQLGAFMDRLHDWLFAAGRCVRDVDDNNDTADGKVAVLKRHYGPAARGGAHETTVFATYRAWLEAQAGMAALQQRVDAANRERDAYQARHAQYFAPVTRGPLQSPAKTGGRPRVW